MVKLPSKNLERKFIDEGYKNIAAIDEVGVGCLAGPVVSCAVIIDQKIFLKNKRVKDLAWIRDSKLLSETQREKYFNYLTRSPYIKWSVSFVSPKVIDKLNIFHATHLSMKRSLKKLIKKPDLILIDGKFKINGLDIPQKNIVKGDRKIFSIACASLIAKVSRDRYMRKISKKYPQYSFDRHKGYGTLLHRKALKKFGPTNIHRRSFSLEKFI